MWEKGVCQAEWTGKKRLLQNGKSSIKQKTRPPSPITGLHIPKIPHYNRWCAGRRANFYSLAPLLSQLGWVQKCEWADLGLVQMRGKKCWKRTGDFHTRSYQCYETTYPQLSKRMSLISHHKDKWGHKEKGKRKDRNHHWEVWELVYLIPHVLVSWDYIPLISLLKKLRS